MMNMNELNNSKTAKAFTGEGQLTLKEANYTENPVTGQINLVINVVENYRPIYINNVNGNEFALGTLDDFINELGIDSRNIDDINDRSGKKFYIRMEANTSKANGKVYYNARFKEKFDPTKK